MRKNESLSMGETLYTREGTMGNGKLYAGEKRAKLRKTTVDHVSESACAFAVGISSLLSCTLSAEQKWLSHQKKCACGNLVHAKKMTRNS